jgi:hypothetical protein
MKIELSSKEYRDLLDILHIADVIMFEHQREEDPRSVRHRAIIQKFYAFARSEGLEQLITYNEREHAYSPSADFEQSTLAHELIHELESHLFWNQLIEKLSLRDAAQLAGGIERLDALSEGERQAVEGPIRQRYIREFTTSGIANLEIVEQFDTGPGMQVRTSD